MREILLDVVATLRHRWMLLMIPMILTALVLGAYFFFASSEALAPVVYSTF